jgi:hypothetical protein
LRRAVDHPILDLTRIAARGRRGMRTQFIVQLENRPGALAELARALGNRGVNIDHVAGGGAGTIGYAAFSTDDDEAARAVLATSGHEYTEGASFVVDLPDRPGGLADVTEKLADAGMSIHGLLVVGRRDGRMSVALAVDDVEAARRVLGLGD